ncbi:hypothetical protein BST81_19970 [Leptolyngbya sp. 'hensonii']|uniref:response regulator n=1 Tax=Leptolyngbya sp. 'hensonii' TaxID=1922337 RepID=UPI00094FABAE|nr:response regulator [Leptolyngbya sp. 'hensonii']OLP16715.1 hypothetical protein BST81_19970 [Leptolyngbya sp. 'hensonii']
MNLDPNLTQQGNILIVDDTPANLQLLSTTLSERGYGVRSALSGALALKSVGLKPPDLVLLDIRMPEMDGYEVCRRLKADERTRDLPVIFLSAIHETFDKVKAFAVGGVDYITKPIDIEELIARIENQLNICRLQQQLAAQNIQLQQEIQERRQAEANLIQSEANYRTLACNIPNCAVFLFDPDLRILVAEGVELSAIGLAQEDLEGRTLPELVDRQACLLLQPYCLQALAAEATSTELPYQEQFYLLQTTPVFDTREQVCGCTALLQNVTARKRAEQEILKTLKREQELGELKSRFVSQVSHEFRTPLTTIQSAAELLEHYNWSIEAKQERFQQIKTAVHHMTQLLEDVLLIGKVESGNLCLKLERFDLSQLCQAVVAELSSTLGIAHHLSFTREGEPVQGEWDRKLLQQVLINLLANAIKYSAEGSEVILKLDFSDSARVRLQVIDRGIGIPAEDQANLFKMFYRARNVGFIQGTGLGLAIVKNCIELHQGEITIASEMNQGTVVTVWLPLKPEVATSLQWDKMAITTPASRKVVMG